jgi:hypothetical protein
MLAPMRRRSALLALGLVACGSPSEAPPSSPTPPPDTAVHWQTLLATPQVEVAVRREPALREAETGLVMRITRRDDPTSLGPAAPILVDLRDRTRVIGPEPAPGPHLPLSDAQRAELGRTSTLAALGDALTYAVPVALPACTGERVIPLGGVLAMLDDVRVIEVTGDGAELRIPCDATPLPLEAGTPWVTGSAPFAAAGRDPTDLASDLPPLLQAASLGGGEVALLSFSYDARPIERFRYDACVASERCPAREAPQPPGSLRAPAVGMTWAAADAFCATRGLHVASAEQRAAIGEPPRPLVEGDDATIVRSGFRCAAVETSGTPPP